MGYNKGNSMKPQKMIAIFIWAIIIFGVLGAMGNSIYRGHLTNSYETQDLGFDPQDKSVYQTDYTPTGRPVDTASSYQPTDNVEPDDQDDGFDEDATDLNPP
jgi:hypothetical protein